MTIESNGKPPIVIKNWHAALVLIGWFVLAIMGYASLYYQVQAHSADIADIRQHSVRSEQMLEMKEDLERRLQRIEDKIDRDHDIRGLH